VATARMRASRPRTRGARLVEAGEGDDHAAP
jgi:hypothetical protein